MAIKQMAEQLSAQQLEEFRREASLMLYSLFSLSSPMCICYIYVCVRYMLIACRHLRPHTNVVQFLGYCMTPTFCLVMEYINGTPSSSLAIIGCCDTRVTCPRRWVPAALPAGSAGPAGVEAGPAHHDRHRRRRPPPPQGGPRSPRPRCTKRLGECSYVLYQMAAYGAAIPLQRLTRRCRSTARAGSCG